MEHEELLSVIEAILFAAGDPVPASRIALVTGEETQTIVSAARELAAAYEENRCGMRLVQMNDLLQLCSAPEYAEYIRRALEQRKPPKLSQPALEVLAIVAYKQPVTQGEIEAVRGIKCDRVIEGLAKKGLVAEVGRSDAVGRPILYGTTDEFLKQFGFETLKELPGIEDIEGIMAEEDQMVSDMDSSYAQQISLDLTKNK